MAEHVDDNDGKFISSGTTSGDLSKTTSSVENGGKSPYKTRKPRKSSLFKRSYPQDEGSALKASGRGKRKSGREKKQDSRENLDEIPQAEVATSVPVQPAAEVGYPYDINTQEVEQKSSVELSVKRIQKHNKDLVKQNTHLVKTVDNLKKEKELLVNERVKLKAEIKSLEKDLKKASSRDHRLTKKMSQPLIDDTSSADIDSLRDKIQVLEDQLTERDHIAALLKQRLDRSNIESEEHEKSSSSSSIVLTNKNGAILDQAAALEMLLDEYETSLKLRRENEDFRSRLSVLETEIGSSKLQRDNPSPKSPRKRSSGFFKRGKKSSSSITSRHALEDTQQHQQQIKGEHCYGRSQTPDILMQSDSHNEQLDVSVSPFLTHNKDSTVSVHHNYNSPNISPQMPTKDRDHVEILTLQSCLKLAVEEKTACKECIAILEKELDGTKSKIAELEDSVSASAEKATAEIERLKSSLNAARIERDTFCGELKIVQTEVDELVDKNEEMDRMFTESLKQKNKLIQDLEQEVEVMMMMNKTKASSSSSSQPSSSKPPAYGVAAATTHAKTPGVMSPTAGSAPSTPLQTKDASLVKASSKDFASAAAKASQQHNNKQAGSSERQQQQQQQQQRDRLPSGDPSPKHTKIGSKTTPSSSGSLERPPPRERLPSSDSSSSSSIKHENSGKALSKGRSSHEKAAKTVSSSPTRKVGRLSRESSIDRFEVPPKEVIPPKPVRKTSNSNIPTVSTHSAKVAATRAMFEQRIGGEVKTDQPKVKWTTKTNTPTDNQRRSSICGPNSSAESQVKPMHSKSYSYGGGGEKVLEQQSTGSPNKPTVTPPATVKEQVNEPTIVLNEARDKGNSTTAQKHQQQQHHWQQPEKAQPNSSSAPAAATARKSKTPPAESVAKVSRITITSVASPTHSPVLGSRKNSVAAAAAAAAAAGVSSPKGPGEQQLLSSSCSSAMLLRHPTSPSLSSGGSIPLRKTPSPTSSFRSLGTSGSGVKGAGQIGQANPANSSATRISTVSATVRHSAPSKAATVSEMCSPPTAHKLQHPSTVEKAQTQGQLHLSSNGDHTTSTSPSSSPSSSSSHLPTSTTSTSSTSSSTAPSVSSSNRVVVKMSSRLGTTAVSKLGSLQNISTSSCQVNGNTGGGGGQVPGGTPPQNNNSSSSSSGSEVKVSTASTTSGIRRGPTHKAMQRRERKERPKTMYAGRAETANLVNLISRFQDAEKKESSPVCPATSKVNGTTSKVNGTTSQVNGTLTASPSSVIPAVKPTTTTTTTTTTSTTSNHTSFVAPLRHSGGREKQTRPTSYCNPTPNKINSSGSNFQPPLSYNNGSNKPLPHERIMQRSRTVAGGLGSAKQSKKAMLLKWCQVITQDYENVNICNFAESFSNGLAFCALIHHFVPEEIPFNTLLPSNREKNFKLAFQTAEGVGIPSLLDVEDMVSLPKPDWMSVMTYVSFIYNKFGQQNQQQNLQQSSMV